jgi:hypothetical protein
MRSRPNTSKTFKRRPQSPDSLEPCLGPGRSDLARGTISPYLDLPNGDRHEIDRHCLRSPSPLRMRNTESSVPAGRENLWSSPGRVGQPHDGEAAKTAGDVDLDRETGRPTTPVRGGGGDGSEHETRGKPILAHAPGAWDNKPQEASATASLFFSGELGVPERKVLRRTSAEPIRLAAS